MAEIETLTEEERSLAEEAIAELEDSERVLSEGTDVGRPELALVLRKMQAGYTALVIERVSQRMRIAELERERDNWMIAEDRAQQRTNRLSLIIENIATVLRSERGVEVVATLLKEAGYPVR